MPHLVPHLVQPGPHVFDLLAHTTDALGEAGFAQSLSGLLRYLSGHQYVFLGLFKDARAVIPVYTNYGTDDARRVIAPYISRPAIYEADPVIATFRDSDADGICNLAELRDAAFYNSTYYKEYYRDTLLEDETGVNLRLGATNRLVISLGSRDRQLPDVSHREAMAQWLPCISALCRRHWQLRKSGRPIAPAELAPAAPHRLCGQAALDSAGLSAREQQILDGVMAGRSNKLLARELGLSPETIKTYRRRMLKKLDVGSSRDLLCSLLKTV